jgi:hypothetical protein
MAYKKIKNLKKLKFRLWDKGKKKFVHLGQICFDKEGEVCAFWVGIYPNLEFIYRIKNYDLVQDI